MTEEVVAETELLEMGGTVEVSLGLPVVDESSVTCAAVLGKVMRDDAGINEVEVTSGDVGCESDVVSVG
jgi:hypothetical protein